MSIVLTETYVVKAERQAEFTPLLNKFLKFKEEHAQLFDGLKSWKLYNQEIGQPSGLYIEMLEFESMAEMEEFVRRIFSDERMRTLHAEFHEIFEPATFCTSIWRPIA